MFLADRSGTVIIHLFFFNFFFGHAWFPGCIGSVFGLRYIYGITYCYCLYCRKFYIYTASSFDIHHYHYYHYYHYSSLSVLSLFATKRTKCDMHPISTIIELGMQTTDMSGSIRGNMIGRIIISQEN